MLYSPGFPPASLVVSSHSSSQVTSHLPDVSTVKCPRAHAGLCLFTSTLALVISSYNKVLNIIINIMGDYQFIFLVWISHLNAGLIYQLLNISIWVSDTRFNLTFSKPSFLSSSLPTPSQLMATLSFHLLMPKPWSQRYIF